MDLTSPTTSQTATPRGTDGPVRDAMTWPVADIDHRASLVEAAAAMDANGVGLLVVMQGERLVGVVSERDLTAHVGAGVDPGSLEVGEIMSVEPVTVRADQTVLQAAQALVYASVRHLPVLREDTVAGVVSVQDVVRVLLEDVVAAR